eukprot:gene4284-30626_t
MPRLVGMEAASGEIGYWGKMDSTIEWCEPNYAMVPWIAEFWNTTSSLLIAMSGLINLYHAGAQGYETRYVLYSCTLIAVGLGSTLYHATLRYDMQMLDELPMLYAMCVWGYIWFEVAHPTVKRRWLVPFLLAFAVAITIGHVSYGFVQTFQVTFVGMVVAGCYNVYLYQKSPVSDDFGSTMTKVYVGAVLVGSLCWKIEHVFCEQLVPNPQLHAWWHACAGISTFASVPLPSVVVTSLGIFPVVQIHGARSSSTDAGGSFGDSKTK